MDKYTFKIKAFITISSNNKLLVEAAVSQAFTDVLNRLSFLTAQEQILSKVEITNVTETDGYEF